MANKPDDFHSLDFDEKLEIEKLQATIRSMSNFSDDSEGFLSQSPKALMEGGLGDSDQQSESDEFDPYAEITVYSREDWEERMTELYGDEWKEW